MAERLRPQLEAAIFGQDEAPEAPPVTRAVLLQIPFATISLQEGDGGVGYAIAKEQNGPYTVYQDSARQSFVLQGGLITGTRGVGRNLNAIKTQSDDPVAIQTPLGGWPERVVRNYQFALRSAADFQITVTCTFAPAVAEQITIVEVRYDVTRVVETCTNGKRTFRNTHWVQADTGFIWQSQQWIGPGQTLYTLRVIRPLA